MDRVSCGILNQGLKVEFIIYVKILREWNREVKVELILPIRIQKVIADEK